MAHYELRAEPLMLSVSLGTPQLTVVRAHLHSKQRQLLLALLVLPSVSGFMTGFYKSVGEAAGWVVVDAIKWLYHWLRAQL